MDEFIRVFLAGYIYISSHENYDISVDQYLYTQHYKAVNNYHRVFCYPESVNTKQENPTVYGTNFTQCICTGYCENWILSLLSFIMNSCMHAWFCIILHNTEDCCLYGT